MFKQFTIADKLLLGAAILSLIFAEITFFQGDKLGAIFCRTLGPINFSFWYLFKTNKK